MSVFISDGVVYGCTGRLSFGMEASFSGGLFDREICSCPRSKLYRLSAGDSVGQRDCIARIRTEVGVGFEVGEHLRDFLGAWKPAGKNFLRDLLERELVSLTIQRGDYFVEAQEVADQR